MAADKKLSRLVIYAHMSPSGNGCHCGAAIRTYNKTKHIRPKLMWYLITKNNPAEMPGFVLFALFYFKGHFHNAGHFIIGLVVQIQKVSKLGEIAFFSHVLHVHTEAVITCDALGKLTHCYCMDMHELWGQLVDFRKVMILHPFHFRNVRRRVEKQMIGALPKRTDNIVVYVKYTVDQLMLAGADFARYINHVFAIVWAVE